VDGWAESEVKTKGFIKTRVKDSTTPSALVFRVDRWEEEWVEGLAEGEDNGGV
jgi:hypothetical protein